MTPIKTLTEAKKKFYTAFKAGKYMSELSPEWNPFVDGLWKFFESTLSSLTEQMIPEEKGYDDYEWGSEAEGWNHALKEVKARREKLLK